MIENPKFKILTPGNPKIAKGLGAHYPLVLMLSPADRSGYQVCPYASPACIELCLNTAGRGGVVKGVRPEKVAELTNIIQQARIRRTRLYMERRDEFWGLLVSDIHRAIAFCQDHIYSHSVKGRARFRPRRPRERKMKPVFRLNGTSDIAWERRRVVLGRSIMEYFPQVQFYDYTKIPRRFPSRLPDNYYMLYSRSEKPESKRESEEYFRHGVNTAVVFAVKRSEPLPRRFWGRPVIDGDDDDLRFLDPAGVIVGLRAKGYAKCDETGFVVRQPYTQNPPVDVCRLSREDFDGGDLYPDLDDVLGHVEWSD